MPFYRGAGVWPHGEESLHEVMAESYVPLLEALTDLHEGGVPVKLTLGITPVLAEQLADSLVIGHFEEYIGREIEAARDDAVRFEKDGEQHFLYLAHFYLDWYSHILQTFQERFGRDIVGGFRRLQDGGAIEILTSGSTHPYLPLMARDSTIHAQLAIGTQATERHFGKVPRAIWLPECAYRPSYYVTDANGSRYERPGLEHWLQEQGLGLFFGESTAVEGSRVLGHTSMTRRRVTPPFRRTGQETPGDLYAQAAHALEQAGYENAGFVTERRVVPSGSDRLAMDNGGTYNPYYVRDSGVAVVGRNQQVGAQVWSADFGYPGDGEYREFHKKESVHGFQYWRVTEGKPDLAYKQPYDPYRAGQKVREHASHFAWLVGNQLRSYSETHRGRQGFIAAAYDTELFGHWWFEGVAWLKEVLSELAANPDIELCTASEWLAAHPPEEAIDLPESSWGHHGTHITWINPETSWMWEAVHEAEHRMEELVEAHPSAEGGLAEALAQAARELVLLEASDWEFLYTTGQARQYATDRFVEHVTRFKNLAAAIEAAEVFGDVEPATLAREYVKRDNLFPDIDYRLFARRQPE